MRPIERFRGLCLSVAMLFALAACSGDTAKERSSGPVLTPQLGADGPLHGIVMVASSRADGTYGDPQLAFTTDDTEVTAIVPFGDEAESGGALTIHWYSWSSFDKREELFSHEMEVGPVGHAFSQGVSAKGLAPGVYETVAKLGEREVRIPWVVRESTGPGSASAGRAGGALALFSPIAQPYSSEDWETPSPGTSGWYEPEAPPQEPAPPGPCQLVSVNAGFTPMAGSNGNLGWIGECSDATLSATVSGPPVEVAGQETAFPGQGFVRAQTQACDLPGGSDLPGTVVKWIGDVGEGGTGSDSLALPDFGKTLEAVIQAADNTPTRVQSGYRFILRGMAIVVPPALGVEKLDVTVGGQVIDSVGNVSGTAQPEPCDPGRLGAITNTSYTVPQSPPPIIDICAKARGFDGTEAESCIQFYTGGAWKGPVTGEGTVPGCSPSTVPVTGDLQIVVGGDGTVTGSVTEVRGAFSCGGTEVPVDEQTYTITGRKTAEAFELDVSGTAVTLPIVGTQATVTFDNPGAGGYGAKVTYTVDCITCS